MPGSSPDRPGDGTRLVLDSWPVMEWLKGRKSSLSRFRTLLLDADAGSVDLLMSGINLGEIYYNCWNEWDRERAESVLAEFTSLPIQIVHPSAPDVLAAARIKAQYKISYSDAFAALLAVKTGSSVITGDPDFLRLQRASVVGVEWWGK